MTVCLCVCVHLWRVRDILGVEVSRVLGYLELDVVCEHQRVTVGGACLCLSVSTGWCVYEEACMQSRSHIARILTCMLCQNDSVSMLFACLSVHSHLCVMLE